LNILHELMCNLIRKIMN